MTRNPTPENSILLLRVLRAALYRQLQAAQALKAYLSAVTGGRTDREDATLMRLIHREVAWRATVSGLEGQLAQVQGVR